MKTNESNNPTPTAAQSTKSTVLLAIDQIRPNPNNPRRSYDENALAELAASIATHGLIQPIRVRAAAQGGYIIVCGERRYRAVQLLGQTEIEAIVDAVPADERAIFDLALSENIQREEMPPLDEAEAYKAAMQTLRGDAAAVAARFGKSEQYIYYRMKLNELIPDAKKLLRGNSITLGLAMELARYGKDLQKTICKDRLKDDDGWRKYSVKEFRRMVDAHYTNDLSLYRFDLGRVPHASTTPMCTICSPRGADGVRTGSASKPRTANLSSGKAGNCSPKTRNSSFAKTVTEATTTIRP